MDENQRNAWMAMNELGDYFSRLGGAARPRNMAESEIPLYVITKLLELHTPDFQSEKYLDTLFLRAAEPVLNKTAAHLESITLNQEELVPFLTDIYEYADTKLSDKEKTCRWLSIGRLIIAKH